MEVLDNAVNELGDKIYALCDAGKLSFDDLAEAIKESIQSAILAEREECAKICNVAGTASVNLGDFSTGNIMHNLAQAIRARSRSAPQPSNQPAESPKISFAGHQPD